MADAVDVVLPVLDEAESIPGVLDRFPPGFRPLVVDNGSSDGSGEIARSLGVRVIDEPRRGFGAACYAGLAEASSDVICFMDCDGSLDPQELPRVAAPVQAQMLDLCLGARVPNGDRAWSWPARLANRAIALELRRRARLPLRDLGPMRAVPRRRLIELALCDRGFGWPLEMVLLAAEAGWRVGEVEVTYRPRTGGRSKVSGSLKGSWRAARDMGVLLR